MSKNVYLLLIVLTMIAVIASAGSYYWQDGEIVRGDKINYALNEKANVSVNEFFVLTPQAAFATASALVGTVYKNSAGQMIYLSTGTTWLAIASTSTFTW